jgi:hypothetical protein
LNPTTSGQSRRKDYDLGIFYTCDRSDANVDLGSIAVVVGKTGSRTMWRFGDKAEQDIDFGNAKKLELP